MDLPYARTQTGNRRRGLKCCGVFAALVVVVVVVMLILGFTVFKIKQPTMRINSVSFNSSGSSLLPSSMVATTDATVTNPNALSLHYKKPDITAYYRDMVVAKSDAPPGIAPARGTVRMHTKMNLNITQLLEDAQFAEDFIMKGLVAFNTSAFVHGKVEILGVIPHKVDLVFNCTLMIDATSFTLKNQTCWQRMWL